MRRRLLAVLALAAAGAMLWHWTERVSAHGDGDHAPVPRPELSIPRSPDYDYAPPVLGSYQLPVIKAAADGRVLDERGEERSLRSLLDGKVTVMAFIYTRCGDICPQATMLLHELHDIAREDPTLREKLRLVTISFDPEYDTPEVMALQAAGVSHSKKDAEWRFLTTSGKTALRSILDAYGQPIGRKTTIDDPLGPFTHQLRVFLIDGDASIRNIYSVGFLDTRLVMTDIRTLLHQSGGAGT